MCWCTPEIRTPFCGRVGCTPPAKEDGTVADDYMNVEWALDLPRSPLEMPTLEAYVQQLPEHLHFTRTDLDGAMPPYAVVAWWSPGLGRLMLHFANGEAVFTLALGETDAEVYTATLVEWKPS